MTKDLIKRVASAIGARDYAQAEAAIREILQWYSEPINITEDMMYAVRNNVSDNEGCVVEKTICVAMRAELEEMNS